MDTISDLGGNKIPRRMLFTLLAVIVAAVFLGTGLAQANGLYAPEGFERKAPREILTKVSGKKQEKVDKLISELGLFDAAKKLGVVRPFI